MKVTMAGIEEISGKLKKNVRLDDVKRAVLTNGAELTRNSQRLAPVDTGRLAGSINLSLEDGGLTAVTRDAVHYGRYVDLGTRFQRPHGFMSSSFMLQSEKFKRDMSMLVK